MIVLTVVFHNNQPVNATILHQDGTCILFWFPIKMPHFKFLFNGTFYSNYANETTLADLNSFLLKNYLEDEIIVFHKKVSQWIDPQLNQKLVKIPLEPVCNPAHYKMPYHACMTCSYCLATSYARNYMRFSEGLPVPQQEEKDLLLETYNGSCIANREVPKPVPRNMTSHIKHMNEAMKRASRNYERNETKNRRYKPYSRVEDLRVKLQNNSDVEERPNSHIEEMRVKLQANTKPYEGVSKSWYDRIAEATQDVKDTPEIQFHYDDQLFDMSEDLLEI